jgi:uncharacterized protein with ParB-like and HNH nuclease domain
MSEIATEKVRLLEILESDNRVIVPRYQRSYSWEIENISELWEDITNTILKDNREHFAGALIFCDSPSSREQLNFEIVDGQQRLISITILLRAIYDNLNSKTGLANDVYDHIERGRYEEKRYFKLTLGETDQEFFKLFIQEKDRPAQGKRGKYKSHKRIVSAYNYFDLRIKELVKGKRRDSELILEELFKKLKQKLIAVRIKVISEVDAYAIFETINSKKADLTVSDLLKNFIFSNAHKISENSLESARQNWESMTEALGQEIEISQYVRHYWISAYERSRDKDLYRKIKDYFKNDTGMLLSFSKMLAKEASIYSTIISPEEDEPNKIIYSSLSDINFLRIRQCYPLILAAMAKKVPPRDLQKILSKIISVSLRRGVTDKNPNEVEAYYAIVAKKVRTDGQRAIKDILSGLNEYNPKDKEIKSYLEENPIAEGLAKFVLLHLEKSKSTEEKIVHRPTLEHILPQNPNKLSDWDMNESEHKNYVSKIGNLTLVGRKFNSSMSNNPYKEKTKELLMSEINIASEIPRKYKSWGKEKIEERGNEILKFIFSEWPGN